MMKSEESPPLAAMDTDLPEDDHLEVEIDRPADEAVTCRIQFSLKLRVSFEQRSARTDQNRATLPSEEHREEAKRIDINRQPRLRRKSDRCEIPVKCFTSPFVLLFLLKQRLCRNGLSTTSECVPQQQREFVLFFAEINGSMRTRAPDNRQFPKLNRVDV